MAETTLTDSALERLRGFADGNGMEPSSLEVVDKNETVYSVHGTVLLTPKFEALPKAYAGAPKRKNVQILSSIQQLNELISEQKRKFTENKDWIPVAVKDLENSAGHGWGLDGYRIDVDNEQQVFAASENCPSCNGTGLLTCPQCNGQLNVICPYCQGQGEESCYNCFGRGEDPVNPGQTCSICRGTRMAPCRYCQSSGKYQGQLLCPTCNGKGGTICQACNGARVITQEISVSKHAEIEFRLGSGTHLPSGLLRAMDRIGLDRMAKGHCDVSILDHEKEGRDKEKSEVKLEAKIPYSEIKLKINNKVHLISVFGKRARLFGVPAFLDEALTPYRESLAATAAGTVAIEKALGARAMRDALKLELEGKGKPDELRRLYPVGLSGDVASEIILNMDSALKRITLKSRSIAAGAILFMNILVLAAYLASPAEEFLAKNVSKVLANFLDVVLPFLCMGIGWVGLSHSATWSLQRLYPDVKVKVVSKIGNLGYVSLAAIPAIYAMIYALTR